MAVEERPVLLVLAEEALVDPLGRQRRRERQVAAGEPLAEAEEVGGDPLLLAGEHRPRAPEPGRDLVGDQEHVVRRAELADPAQEAGRLDEDPGGPLDQRLDDHRGDLAPVQLEQALRAGRASPGSTWWVVEQQRAVGAVEEVDAADRDRADRVAVVGVGEGDERGPAPVLGAPRCRQYWNAIFSAISTAVEPDSE